MRYIFIALLCVFLLSSCVAGTDTNTSDETITSNEIITQETVQSDTVSFADPSEASELDLITYTADDVISVDIYSMPNNSFSLTINKPEDISSVLSALDKLKGAAGKPELPPGDSRSLLFCVKSADTTHVYLYCMNYLQADYKNDYLLTADNSLYALIDDLAQSYPTDFLGEYPTIY